LKVQGVNWGRAVEVEGVQGAIRHHWETDARSAAERRPWRGCSKWVGHRAFPVSGITRVPVSPGAERPRPTFFRGRNKHPGARRATTGGVTGAAGQARAGCSTAGGRREQGQAPAV